MKIIDRISICYMHKIFVELNQTSSLDLFRISACQNEIDQRNKLKSKFDIGSWNQIRSKNHFLQILDTFWDWIKLSTHYDFELKSNCWKCFLSNLKWYAEDCIQMSEIANRMKCFVKWNDIMHGECACWHLLKWIVWWLYP
jgi:hypothetical protein